MGHLWLTTVILATQEAEITRIVGGGGEREHKRGGDMVKPHCTICGNTTMKPLCTIHVHQGEKRIKI
jgi:hypothetical protein